MKLILEKLGRIDHAEIDLRPLTVFVGPNNTNKSWAAYTAYSAIEALGAYNRAKGAFRVSVDDSPSVEGAIGQLRQAFQPVIDGQTDSASFQLHRDDVFNVEKPFHVSLTPSVLARELSLNEESLSNAKFSLQREVSERKVGLFESLVIRVQRAGNLFAVQTTLKSNQKDWGFLEHVDESNIEDQYLQKIGFLLQVVYWRVAPFPVERQALLTSVDHQSNRPDSLESLLQSPVRDFLAWTREARRIGAVPRPDYGGDPALKQFLSERVLGGEVGLAANGAVGFTVEGAGLLPLQASASMVRSLAGLSLYLDYLARPGDVLVIDEPEMNAHPRAQMALAELFAVMVNRGYRVLITTHSPYIVDHLNNLMAAARLAPEAREQIAGNFRLGSAEAFIDPDKVAVAEFYEREDGGVEVRDALDREEILIDTTTFGRWSDRLSDLYNDVLSAEE